VIDFIKNNSSLFKKAHFMKVEKLDARMVTQVVFKLLPLAGIVPKLD
jgi:hypothetical protein